jgi:hypothetical protein
MFKTFFAICVKVSTDFSHVSLQRRTRDEPTRHVTVEGRVTLVFQLL